MKNVIYYKESKSGKVGFVGVHSDTPDKESLSDYIAIELIRKNLCLPDKAEHVAAEIVTKGHAEHNGREYLSDKIDEIVV